jgi:peptidyl-dipeptidase A
MKSVFSTKIFLVATLSVFGNANVNRDAENEFRQFLKTFETKVIPLSREAAVASYNASISGKADDYKRSAELQVQFKKLHSAPSDFAKLKTWRSTKTLADPLLKRQLDLLYHEFLRNQLPEATLTELVDRQTDIEKAFNTFRATLAGKTISDNELDKILGESADSALLEQAWKASKEIGKNVAPAIVELVKLRNNAAKSLGFKNFQVMQLALGEQDPSEIEKLFDQLDQLTRADYAKVKRDVDAFLATRLSLKPEALRPWHYQDRFFQEAPKIYPVDLDGYYTGKNLVDFAERYYAGIGMPIGDILARSDLFEKPGKYQHAFCTDIDRSGDVRILCSMKPNAYWMNTLLHEAGHGAYSKFNDSELPWLLRDSAHAFTTEAIANLFGRFASNPAWLQDMAGVSPAERAKIELPLAQSLRLEQLVFSRWSQVMFRFEKSLYENPDQDLNKLWWDLAERFQMLTRPEGRVQPDWAAKIHVALYPAYYHNYLMGQLLASQLHHHIARKVLKAKDLQSQSFAGRKEAGKYLIEKVFKPGMRYPWSEMIEKATGEKLTPKYYAEQFVGK